MNIEKQIEMAVSDAVTEKPIELKIGSRKFKINPPTIGKMQILSKYYLMLDLDEEKLQENPQLEAMRVCRDKSDIVTELMAVATFNNKDDLLNSDKIKERAEYFKWNSKVEEFSIVLLALLTQTQYENFITSIRLTEILRQNKPK
jgi:nitrate reductase beta subunit